MIQREAHLPDLIFVFFQHLLAGEEGEDVQLVLGDDTQETQDCADELQLEIEDLFEEVDVVQDLDTDEAEGYSFDTDAGYYGELFY